MTESNQQQIAEIQISDTPIIFDTGETNIIVGANGSGKTRLAVYIEKQLGEKVHRIAAHRALSLNPQVEKISEEKAKKNLRYYSSHSIWEGASISNRESGRWDNKPATLLLNDFNRLLQVLFAEQANRALQTHKAARENNLSEAIPTLFENLQEAWQDVLPHRKLKITGDDILVVGTNHQGEEFEYSASEMSDGERAVFYILGQVLVAEPSTILIFDEPELHIHKSIMSKLWDKIEILRPDCSFLLITHDIEFASTRIANKWVIKQYTYPERWELVKLHEDEYFDEQTVSLILGSRKPILFVEGKSDSLDNTIYRRCYPDWTVISRNSCSDVIHSVGSFSRIPPEVGLSVKCAGIIDNDGYTEDEIENFKTMKVFVLPVAEIENLLMLSGVLRYFLEKKDFKDRELTDKADEIKQHLISQIESTYKQEILKNFFYRRLDRKIKLIVDKKKSIDDLQVDISQLIHDINQERQERDRLLTQLIQDNDLDELMKYCDHKALLGDSARQLGMSNKSEFENWIKRILSSNDNQLITIIQNHLPRLEVQPN